MQKNLYHPGNMPRRIREYCKQTGQTVPETPGEIVCCINQSLAMKYRRELDKIQYCLNKKYDTIHMIGGGIKSKLLCQMTANATGSRSCRPVEATAFEIQYDDRTWPDQRYQRSKRDH